MQGSAGASIHAPDDCRLLLHALDCQSAGTTKENLGKRPATKLLLLCSVTIAFLKRLKLQRALRPSRLVRQDLEFVRWSQLTEAGSRPKRSRQVRILTSNRSALLPS